MKGYVIESACFDYNDEHYTLIPDVTGLATNRVFVSLAGAERVCRKRNRSHVDNVLVSPSEWAGYEGPLGRYLESTIGYDQDRFRELVDALLPPKEYPDLDRDSQQECVEVLDGIQEWDLENMTNSRRDVLIARGPEIFGRFRVVEVEIK